MRKKTEVFFLIMSLFLGLNIQGQKMNQVNQVVWDNLPWEKITDNLYRKYAYGSSGMVAQFKMDAGAHVPLHNHPNEQITYITKGSVKVLMQGKEYIVKSGEMLIIPPNVPHEFFCIENGTIDVDFFPTLRMDWINGTASYFGPKPQLEEVAVLDIRPGDVAVSPTTGRVFATIHPLGSSKLQLVEIQKDKSYKAYPDMSFQKNGLKASANKFDAMLGIVFDKKGTLWVTDMGLELGTSRIWNFDIQKNKLIQKIDVPADISPAGSFNQDIVVDEKNDWVYLADISQSAIIALNLKTKKFRRFTTDVLKAENIDIIIDGKVVNFGGVPARVGADPITLSDDRETIFFGAMNSENWYSVPANLFRSEASDDQIKAAIKKAGRKPLSDGAFTDKDGEHYFTDLQNHAITKLANDGMLYSIIKDEKLKWPDNIYIHTDGFMYISVNQLNSTPAFTDGKKDEGKPPYYIYKYPVNTK